MCENPFDEEATVEVNHVVKNVDVLDDSKKCKPDGDIQHNEIVYPACVVTRAMSKRRQEFDDDLEIGDIFGEEDVMTTDNTVELENNKECTVEAKIHVPPDFVVDKEELVRLQTRV
ncbi:hypothetical protein Hamer_G028931 [Homarus americanus]|uniref:Uncharacterized protein n=1 Tax=Homarus americanus TaxID=6706 RepID=A0A8J5ML57_HOMAM|nr:hypothetical protein Hamer_G029917 [Homarus americanus]KAG7168638.1 hypothetical protein Hamer_G028931 [Homarus americanus]